MNKLICSSVAAFALIGALGRAFAGAPEDQKLESFFRSYLDERFHEQGLKKFKVIE